MGKRLYIGIDIGGTKIAAGLVDQAGTVLSRRRISSSGRSGRQVVSDLILLVRQILREHKLGASGLAGIGIAVPGLVDSVKGRVLVTPNMGLSGLDLAQAVRKKFRVPVKIGNDVNLGVLGEKWLGAGRGAGNIVGVFPGTGVGGGVVINGVLLTGAHGAAAELGHIIIDPHGPVCTCGNKGCLEAFIGRWAIQRDIRSAVRNGKKTVVTELAKGNLKLIKSKILAQALKKKDKVVTAVMREMAAMLGTGCVSLRHIFDPQVIILGGGLMEACGGFILPVVRKAVKSDPFFRAFKDCKVVEARLKDDAVMLGAVAVCLQGVDAQQEGCDDVYPQIGSSTFGEVVIGHERYKKDVYIRADGKIKKRNKRFAKLRYGTSHAIGPDELKKVCKKDTDTLIIASGQTGSCELLPEAEQFLKDNGIVCSVVPTPQAIILYNKTPGRKAILIHVTC